MTALDTATQLSETAPAAAWHTVRQKSPNQQAVEAFMLGAGQKVPSYAGVPSAEERLLRAHLIMEEAMETVAALGFDVRTNGWYVRPASFSLRPAEDAQPKLSEIADGCADLIVVATGTLSACGLADMAIQDEVNQNNLLKLGPGHTINQYGKLIKPAGHPAPRLEEIVLRQTPEQE